MPQMRRGAPLRLKLPRSQVNIQGSLLPQVVNALLAHPVDAVLGDLEVKVPEHARQDETHFDVGQARKEKEVSAYQLREEEGGEVILLLSKTIPRTKMERLERLLVIRRKSRIAKPALRVKGEWILEVLVVVVRGPLVDCHDVLQHTRFRQF